MYYNADCLCWDCTVSGPVHPTYLTRAARYMRRWSQQISEALSYLHSSSPKVVHRDLKVWAVDIQLA